ncbi:MAG: SpaA isopeptide-forming pilin-related protein, partial [Vagococcus sp.]
MKRVFNLVAVFIIACSQLIMPGSVLVNAEGSNDVSSLLWQNISVDHQDTSDGSRLSVTATFDDSQKKITAGDEIYLSWPQIGNATMQAYASTKDIIYNGVNIGQAVITSSGVRLVFNEGVNQFDQGTVHGGIEFKVQVNNTNSVTSTENININGGNISVPISVSKEVSDGGTGTGTRNFSDKNGVIYVSDPTRVMWDISLNSNKEPMVSNIVMADTIKDSPGSHTLLPETFYIEVASANGSSKTFRGVEGVEEVKNQYGATFDYSVEQGTINVVIPQSAATYNSFRIVYYTQITDTDVASFTNNLEVDYQVHGQAPQHDSRDKEIENINSNAWGEGSKTSRLTILKQDTEGKPLADAKFVLKDKKGKIVKADLVSDAEGKIEVTQLTPGEYYLEETDAPKGYKILTEDVYINVNKPTIEEKVTNEREVVLGRLEINKVETNKEDTHLANAKFVLTSNETGTTYEVTTNEAGQGIIEGLPLGAYTLKEIEAPAGYVLNNTEYPIEIKEDETTKNTTQITVANDPIIPVGQLTIVKVDAKDKEVKLSGAEFTLTSATDGQTYHLVTNDQGEVTTGEIPAGDYTLVETKAPAGYLLNTESKDVKIEKDQTIKLAVENTKVLPWTPLEPSKPILGSVEVTKVDAEDNTKVLSGAEFKLTSVKDGKEYTLVTDADGKAKVSDLPVGTYTLVETKAPKGYVLDETPQTVEVKYDETTSNVTTLTVSNEKETPWTPLEPSTTLGSVRVMKVDANNQSKVLPGTKFNLTSKTTGKIYSLITNDKGIAEVTNLPLGKYDLQEIQSAAGYLLDSKIKELTIKENKDTNNEVNLTVTNTAVLPWTPLEPSTPLGSVEVTKVDAEDNTKVLSGAEFKLTSKADGKEYTLVTDAEGKAKVSQLALGEYTLVETKAPEGYVLDETPQTIEVKKDEATKNVSSITVSNEKETPWTPLEPSTPLGSVEVTK